MNLICRSLPTVQPRTKKRGSSESGFTLVETAISLVIMMVAGLAAASLFAYSIHSNTNANDRELALAVAQKRMEWFRNIPFSTANRSLAYSFPNGGLGATAGTTETTTSAGRTFTVVTTIVNNTVVPAGLPDAGAPTVKTITVTVTPIGVPSLLGSVTISTQRSTMVPGTF
jgi:Tfp pilus assembly protein PilV